MFDLIVSAIQAYNQIGMFFGALICLGIGGFILANSFYWRVHAIRATGTVVGVIPEGNTLFPVYRYYGPDGRSHEAKSDSGSSSVAGKNTGEEVEILVSAHNPGEARERNDYLFDIIGLAFLVPGLWIGYIAVTAFPFTRMTFLVGVGFAVYAGERLYRIFKSVTTRLTLPQWQQHSGTIDLSKVQPVEKLADPNLQSTQRSQLAANRKVLIPLLGVFAIALAGAGAYQAQMIYRLETSGMRAEGEVVRIVTKSDSDHGGSTYYPVVRFRTADNEAIEFQDQMGSNPPAHRTGDKVTVLYLAASPGKSIIDRGEIINWGIPAILLAAAALVGWLAGKVMRARPVDSTAPA
jgi:hypothetical protein